MKSSERCERGQAHVLSSDFCGAPPLHQIQPRTPWAHSIARTCTTLHSSSRDPTMSRPMDEEEPSLLLILLDCSCAFWTKREALRQRQNEVRHLNAAISYRFGRPSTPCCCPWATLLQAYFAL